MAADTRPSRLSAWSGFAGLDDVGRVDRYTRWSFHLLLWFFPAIFALDLYAAARAPWQGAVTLVLVVGLCVVGSPAMSAVVDHHPEQSVPRPRLLGGYALACGAVAAWGTVVAEQEQTFFALVVVSTLLVFVLGGLRITWLPWALVAVTAGPTALLSGWVQAGVVALVVLFLVFTMRTSLWLLGVVRELDRARRAEAELAVAEERLRFSRDVHDVLGRHLSVIAVQAELAAAMVERGDQRAVERIREVRTTAHDALREAREIARGYRELDLAHELRGAVALLGSAGIDAEVHPAALAGLPRRWHEPVARVVREAVTNVLRHSSATRVEITWVLHEGAHGVLEIRNDQPAAPTTTTGSSGLRTLTTDLAVHGLSLTHGVEETPDGAWFVLRIAAQEER